MYFLDSLVLRVIFRLDKKVKRSFDKKRGEKQEKWNCSQTEVDFYFEFRV